MESHWNRWIERYLNNELSAEEKTTFEAQLASNTELQKEFELHTLTQQLIRRNSLRILVEKSGKWFHTKKLVLKSALILVIAGALAAGVYATLNWDKISGEPEFMEEALLEKMERHLAFENIDPEYFQFTGESDVFLSESGVLLSITDKSFLLNGKAYKGEAIVQWQEAQKGSDIVKAGLSTKSGDRLLETQGMFSLNAFTPEGQKLKLTNEGVYVQVPVNETKKDMKLFTGVPGKDGGIDWQKPEELERLPKPKDMSEMDLYPPDFEPKLNELKWFTEKDKRDSLYLSFERLLDTLSIVQDAWEIVNPMESYEDALERNSRSPGEILYKQYCVTCHMASRDGTGPKLFQVRQKWADGGAKEGAIYQWVPNWPKAAASDPYAREVSNIKHTAMNTFPQLEGKTEEIDAIFDYIDGELYAEELAQTDAAADSYLIPPSKVLAIWNPKFNGTNLATQDFEDRMKAIHGTCNKKVLEIYVSNLNTPLWKLDERVVNMGYSEFQVFADQKVGVIKIDDAHQKNLNGFYEKAIETIREKGKKNLQAALKKERKWDQELAAERDKEQLRKGMRESANLEEEYGFNLENVGKQLGKTLGFQIHGEGTVVNIDAYVREATIARESMFITDPETGKTAKITYEPMTMEVKNSSEYGNLYLYLFSKEINSYQRLDFNNGSLEYNLNGDMNYTAAIIGINENGYFYREINELKAGDLGTFSLEKISEGAFEQKITKLNKNRTGKPMDLKDELKWLFKEKVNYEVQKKRLANASFRREIEPTIYRCQMEMNSGPWRGL